MVSESTPEEHVYGARVDLSDRVEAYEEVALKGREVVVVPVPELGLEVSLSTSYTRPRTNPWLSTSWAKAGGGATSVVAKSNNFQLAIVTNRSIFVLHTPPNRARGW